MLETKKQIYKILLTLAKKIVDMDENIKEDIQFLNENIQPNDEEVSQVVEILLKLTDNKSRTKEFITFIERLIPQFTFVNTKFILIMATLNSINLNNTIELKNVLLKTINEDFKDVEDRYQDIIFRTLIRQSIILNDSDVTDKLLKKLDEMRA